MRPLRRNRRPIRRSTRPTRAGCKPACCTPSAPCEWYYLYDLCPPGSGACVANPPSAYMFVHAGVTCNGTRLCDFQFLPGIVWGGRCWQPGFDPACLRWYLGASVCGIPCDAPTLKGVEVSCTPATIPCGAPVCSSDFYIFPKRCPGAGSGPIPQVYICGDTLATAFNQGIRCPASRLSDGLCYYWDWANPSASLPAGYTQVSPATFHDGCCTCLGGDCTTALAHQCAGLPPTHPTVCCAHAVHGRSIVQWHTKFTRQAPGSNVVEEYSGTVRRQNGVIAGFRRFLFTVNGTVIQDETLPIGPLATSNPFSLSELIAGVPGAFPCAIPVGGGCPPGTTAQTRTTGNCYFHQSVSSYSCQGGLGPETGASTLAYICIPNPGVCEDGCAQGGWTYPGTPSAEPNDPAGAVPTPCLDLPGLGDSLTIGALEILGV